MAQVRAELTPVVAGRFVVYGSHDRERIPPNWVGLEIEAAQAFGTGHHATHPRLPTRARPAGRGAACRPAGRGHRRRHRRPGDGGGRGLAGGAIAGDIDPVATATARANVAANGLAARVACVTAAGFRHPRLQAGAPYDLIFANILAGPLAARGDLAAHQAPGGVAILSGILARQARGVAAVYRAWGYRPRGDGADRRMDDAGVRR